MIAKNLSEVASKYPINLVDNRIIASESIHIIEISNTDCIISIICR